MKLSIDILRDRGLILLEVLSGSHAYGLNVPTSDRDLRGVFVLPQDELYGLHSVNQVADEKNDIVFYELGRFFELLCKNNPTILELLAPPEDCIIYRHPIMDLVQPADVLSKICKDAFGGYARAQIKKARGFNKKVVNPIEKKRKWILDFCYIVEGQGSVPAREWLGARGWDQIDCGLVNIPHMQNVFALFHANSSDAKRLGLKGIAPKDNSNSVALSSIPKEMDPVGTLSFNKNGYSTYCKDYKAYWEWVELRNEDRYESNVAHGKNYDAKNMMHTFRLLDMAHEIAAGEIFVRRPNREELLAIRRGERNYDSLLEMAEARLPMIDEAYAQSTLPDKPDVEKLNSILIKMRQHIYENWPPQK